MRMHKRFLEIVGLAALVFAAGCDTLNISDPNDLDSRRALTQPTAIRAIVLGGFRGW